MKQLEALRRKIQPNEIQWRIQSARNGKTTVVPYLTNRCVMERFDEQFTPYGWQNTFVEWRSKGVKCGISAKVEGEWITKYDGADETNIEATKGGFSDSMKRAAVQWGLGRDLYDYPMIQLDGEYKYMTRNHTSQLADVAKQVAEGLLTKDYVLIKDVAPTPQAQPKPQAKKKPELKPETEQWKKAIQFLVDGGLISKIEAGYALSEVNKQLLMDTVLEKA